MVLSQANSADQLYFFCKSFILRTICYITQIITYILPYEMKLFQALAKHAVLSFSLKPYE